jgi:hypothetical protein
MLFSAWLETVYHRHTHSETGQTPLERFAAGAAGLRYPSAEELHEAFLWSEHRTVTKTATVSLFSNAYEVDAALAGRKVELVFDPFDLTRIEVRWAGRPMGTAIPHKIGRHAHPGARPEPGVTDPAPTTGIDYRARGPHRHPQPTRTRRHPTLQDHHRHHRENDTLNTTSDKPSTGGDTISTNHPQPACRRHPGP